MDFSKAFTGIVSSEQATTVPVVHEVTSFFREEAGIGSKGATYTPSLKDRSLDISQTLPKDVPAIEEMAKMSFGELRGLREKYTGNKLAQNYIAPYEHRAMNRGFISEGSALEKLVRASSLSVAVPVYAAAKVAGVLPEDVDTSTQYVEEMKQGFIGIGEGLQGFFSPKEDGMKREVSPEVQKGYVIQKQVNQIMGNLIKTESSGRHTTAEGKLLSSEKGALGITQVLPTTAKKPGYGIKPLQNNTEEEYIRFGKDYLTKMISIFDDVEQGIAAYNAGPAAVHRAIAKSSRTGKDWKEHIPKETQEYIKKIGYTEEEQGSSSHRPNVTDIMGFRG